MNLADLVGRVHRLDQLMRGLAREVALWKEGTDPLLHQERRIYLKGIQDALAGVETARAALAQARQRLQAEENREAEDDPAPAARPRKVRPSRPGS